MKEEISNIVKTLKTVTNEECLVVDDNNLFELAVRLYISGKIAEQRKETTANRSNIAASEKQISTLIKMGYKLNFKDLTMKEADRLIKEGIANKKW